jgi:hypothetical protein
MNKVPLTLRGAEKLREELQILRAVKRPNVPTVYLPSFFEAFKPACISPRTRSTVRPASALESFPFFATRSISAALLIADIPVQVSGGMCESGSIRANPMRQQDFMPSPL